MFTLRILLVMCDVNDHQAAIKELTKTALINNLTMIVAWSAEEAGRYVETYKSFEHKPPDLIKERIGEDYLSQVTNVLTQVRGVNKTDVVTLLSRFGSVKGVVRAGVEGDEVGMCPGFGEVKAKRLREVFTQPFRVGEGRSYKQRKVGTSTNETTDSATSTTTAADSAAVSGNNATSALRLLEEQDDLLTSSTTPNPVTTSQAQNETSAQPPTAPTSTSTSTRALDALEENFDDLTEEEQLRLAMQMSMDAANQDGDDDDDDVVAL